MSVELHRDGERIAVRPGKTTEVLIRLALEAGVMVRTERLIEDLWADEAVATARNTLQTKVSRLRRALGDAALGDRDRAPVTRWRSTRARSMRSRCFASPSRRPRFEAPATPSAALRDVRDGAGACSAARSSSAAGDRPTGSSRTAPASRRSVSVSSRISSPPGSISARRAT